MCPGQYDDTHLQKEEGERERGSAASAVASPPEKEELLKAVYCERGKEKGRREEISPETGYKRIKARSSGKIR